ncbi:unnamed protein product, partial [marine sediment metagenome]
VRYDFEWYDEHIDTPVPENPRRYCLCWLLDPAMLEKVYDIL